MPVRGKPYKTLMDELREKYDAIQVSERFVNSIQNWGDPVLAEATIIVHDGDDTLEFKGLGDATPQNCGQTADHYPRMAGTRAKARAAREALGEGEAADEEFRGDGGEDSRSSQSRQSSSRSSSTRKSIPGRQNQSSQGSEDAGDRSLLPATKKQRSYLKSLIEDAVDEEFGGDYDAFEEEYGEIDLEDDEITRVFASELIEKLR